MKKILALILAVLLMASAFTAFADDAAVAVTTSAPITIVPVSEMAVNVLEVPEASKIVCSTWQEIWDACQSAKDGDVIGIASGTYMANGSRLTLDNRHNVVLRSVTGNADDVIIKGRGFHKDYENDHTDEPIAVSNGSTNVIIYGITIADTNCHGIKLEGDGDAAINNITIDSCKFYNINERMIKGTPSNNVRKGIANIRISNNWFENDMIPEPGDHSPGFYGDYIAGMDLMQLNGAVISDNTFVNIRGYGRGARGGIFCWNGGKNVTAERNLFIGCDRGVCFGNPGGDESPKIAQHMDGGIIRNNVVIDAHDIGIELGRVGSIHVYNNTVMNRLAKGSRGITQSFTKGEKLVIENNLVYNKINCPDAVITNNVSDFNESYFVDVDTGNMALTDKAVNAIGRATPLEIVPTDMTGKDRSKTAPSIGAYEYDGPAVVVTPKTFDDIQTSWCKPAVEYMATVGYINGTTDKTFSPQDTITRAQFLSILMRIMGLPVNGTVESYPDVAEGAYYAEYVEQALSNGILTETDGTAFRPNEPVTREDAFTWVARAIKPDPAYEDDIGPFEAAFSDVSLISYTDAYEAIAALFTRGYMKGSDGKINPLLTMTRAEGAQLLYNTISA